MENIFETDILESTSQAFLDYSAYNLQRRAIPDARDGLRWSQRQLLHAQNEANLDHKHPFKKAQKSVSAATSFSYCHGDMSAYGIFIRMAKPFVYRTCLQEVTGNYGTQIDSESHAASRYVELRGSALAAKMLEDLDKDVIIDWEDTYDMQGKFPKVLPAKGFTNLVNGCQSIGSGMNCSIPPTNLREVNEALIKLLQNPNINDEEIICMPDFPTGATLLNREEVKQSLLHGEGAACKIRSTIEYDKSNNELIVSDLPYQTYTNTICKQIAELIDEDENCGIAGLPEDYTGKKVDLHIKLKKNANVDKVIKLLYKKTSLQSFFAVNLVLLDRGITPRVFTWKEALQAHIDHEKDVYRRGFQFDLNKIANRIHIINGLIICIASIDSVIHIIKASTSSATATKALCDNFLLDEAQAKAVLDMKLAKLANLEVKKLEDELQSLEKDKTNIENILNNTELFNNELIKGWRETAAKFGDERRTKIMNIESETDEPTEIKNIRISLTNKNNIFAIEESSLYVQRRGTTGTKIKLPQNEYIIDSLSLNNNQMLLLFSQNGNYYHVKSNDIPLDQLTAIEALLKLKDDEKICAITTLNSDKQNILFFTKMGLIKKSLLSEYNTNRAVAAKALNLDPGDEIVSVLFTNEDKVGMLTEMGNFIIVETSDIRAIGRTTRGIRGIKLNDGDYVISAKIVKPNAKQIISVSGNGLIKRTDINEFSVQGKNTKGAKIQKLNEEDWAADFLPIDDVSEIVVNATSSCVKININDIPLLSKGTLGVKGIKLKLKDNVIGLN